MKNLLITLTEEQYALACLRVLDPQIHLQNFAEVMAHNAMQELGYQQQVDGKYRKTDIDVALENPSAQQRQQEFEAQRAKDNKEAELTAARKKIEDEAQSEANVKKQAEQRKQDALELLKDPAIFAAMMKAQGVPMAVAPALQ